MVVLRRLLRRSGRPLRLLGLDLTNAFESLPLLEPALTVEQHEVQPSLEHRAPSSPPVLISQEKSQASNNTRHNQQLIGSATPPRTTIKTLLCLTGIESLSSWNESKTSDSGRTDLSGSSLYPSLFLMPSRTYWPICSCKTSERTSDMART